MLVFSEQRKNNFKALTLLGTPSTAAIWKLERELMLLWASMADKITRKRTIIHVPTNIPTKRTRLPIAVIVRIVQAPAGLFFWFAHALLWLWGCVSPHVERASDPTHIIMDEAKHFAKGLTSSVHNYQHNGLVSEFESSIREVNVQLKHRKQSLGLGAAPG